MRRLLVLLMFAASPAWGQNSESRGFLNGNELDAWFHQATATSELSAKGYVLGAFDELQYIQATRKTCFFKVPQHALAPQITDVVKLFLEKHPERRDDSAGSIVFAAVAEAWPCSPTVRTPVQ